MNPKELVKFHKQKVLEGVGLSFESAVRLWKADAVESLCEAADDIRTHFFGDHFELCSITNARSGRCPENCKWCAQSVHYHADIDEYELVDQEPAISQAKHNAKLGVHRYSLVTSGKTTSDKTLEALIDIYRRIREETDIHLCASLGLLDQEKLTKLKNAGIKRYHCNLETARSFFPELCSTHSFQEKVETIQAAQDIGLDVCSGGIIGMGESMEQRIELAFELKRLNIKSIPINILHPIKGTPLGDAKPLSDQETLAAFALFRFINPDAYIRFAGGRAMIRHIQDRALKAGVNAALVGDLLTTLGSNITEDIENFKRLGFNVESTSQ